MYVVTYAETSEDRHPWKRGFALGGAALAGAVLGARTLPRLVKRGRLLTPGESNVGKIVFVDQGLTTPLELLGRRHRWERKAFKGSKLAKGVTMLDRFFGLPQRHYGVGVGAGRYLEKTKSHGIRILDSPNFARGHRIRVDSAVPLETQAQMDAFNARYEASLRGSRKSDLNLITNNCEHYVRDIAGQGRKSFQTRAIVGGAVGGASLGAGGLGGALYLKDRRAQTYPRSIRPKTPTYAQEAETKLYASIAQLRKMVKARRIVRGSPLGFTRREIKPKVIPDQEYNWTPDFGINYYDTPYGIQRGPAPMDFRDVRIRYQKPLQRRNSRV